MKKKWFIGSVVFLTIVAAIWLKNDEGKNLSTNEVEFKSQFKAIEPFSAEADDYEPRKIISKFDQESNLLRNDPNLYFEQAKQLEVEEDEGECLKHLKSLLDEYVIIVKGDGYPTGLNPEITNALLGKNDKKIALLSANHGKINSNGELCDSWGSPYHFHSESLEELSIRSAGPDKKLFTADDIEN